MKTILQLKLALLIALIIPQLSFAQYTNHERDTKWNVGFNIGGVWQDGDIKLDRPGFGYGFTIGKGIYEDPGKFWSIDARFRYMKGFTYGQELTKLDSADIMDNTIYSSNPSNYKNTLGYTYLNNKTMIHDFSLEGVLNFHMLRERTGVLLSVFGGLGVTDYKTRTNLLDSENFNKLYNYNDIDESNATKRDFRELQDSEYENRGLYNTSEDRTVRFMPSLGIGLGYQFTPQWSFGFEHKVTFALHDEFEGLRREGTEFLQWGDNDKYHYSSVFLRLNIFRGDNSGTTSSKKCPPPYVKIADIPNNYVVNEKQLSIRARVSKIKTNNDVILVSNDQIFQTAYNKNTDYVYGNVMLAEGVNKIYFIATNVCGESMDSVVVIYNPDFCPKAVITITEPSSVINAKKAKLTAKVLQLQGGSLLVKLNNQVVVHTFNSSTRILNADLDLNVGSNVVSIKAINKCGDTTVIKNIEYRCISPTVSITKPQDRKKYESQSNQMNFSAKATNIIDLNQIQVLVNGASVIPSFNKSNGVVSGNFTMNEGSNTVSITVTNDCGTQTKNITFIYEKPCLLPVVAISAPRNNQIVTSSSISVTGTVSNITDINNVKLKVNGVLVASNFRNGSLSSVVNLNLGTNTIELFGLNICGTDSETISVVYNCPKPVVSITSPNNGSNINTGKITITGSVSNVSSKSQINVTVNGSSIPFVYNTSNRTISATTNLSIGQNVIVISANTTCGNDTKSSTVFVSAPCPGPVVNILTPQNGSNKTNNVVVLTGTAINVSNQSELNVTLNGVTQSISFNAISRTFSSTINLRTGSNTIIVKATTSCGSDSKNVIVSYSAPCPSPIISILSPSNGSSVTSSSVSLRGTAINVNNKSDISVTLNGVNQSFSYNSTTKIFTANLSLSSGNNTILVSGTTNCGIDSKSVNISYSQSCPKPVVSISSPRNGLNSNSPSVSFVGNVQNVTSSSQITLKVNGVVVNKNFNTITKIVTTSLNLNQGGNTIELIATNSCGTDSKMISVSYNCPIPSINIASPNTGMRYTTNPITFSGFVSGVSTKNQIVIKQNGTIIPFTYNAATSKFSGTMTMIEGSNTLLATVTNQCGSGSKSTTVTYTKPCPTPTVSFSTPRNGASLTTSTVTVSGIANNLNTKADMQLKVNGVNTAFSYNSTTKMFSANVTLIEGNNTILATVATNCGNDSKTINVVYTKPCPKPTVTIINPINGSTPVDQYISINGVTTNVTSKSQMTLTLNGVAIPFTFNASTNSFNTNYDLTEGNNVIVATVTNSCGTQTKTVTIGYTKPCPKPTVTIINPINGSTPVDQYISINGVTTNVSSKSQMTLTLNGVAIPFTFNASSNSFNANYDLTEGSNVIVATVTNSCGTQTKSVTIGYSTPCPKPVVSVSSPINGARVTGNKVSISGISQNLVTQSDMQIRVNGLPQTFSYNSSTGMFSASLTLVPGKNYISVSAATNCGNDTKTIKVTSVLVKPVIRVNNPGLDTTTTSSTKLNVFGEVEKITSQSKFSIKLNGTTLKGYTFTKVSTEKYAFNSHVTLRTGYNVITITAVHATGTTEVVTKVVNVTSKFSSPGSTGKGESKGELELPSSGGKEKLELPSSREKTPTRGSSRP